MIFIDTSAFVAILNINDKNHQRAKEKWLELFYESANLYTNNYIVIESVSIIQKRHGLDFVKKLEHNLLGFVEIDWIDKEYHIQALDAVISTNRRNLSLVDTSAFATMRRLGINQVFTFDRHFAEQGFEVLPG